MFRLSRKYKVCRSFNSDLWGTLRTKQVLNATFVQFVKQYKQRRSPASPFARVTVSRRFKRRSLYGNLLNFRKKLLSFYGGVNFSLPKWQTSQEQMLHLLFTNVAKFETRLSTVLYRSHFSASVLESLIMILSGGVLVNKKVVRSTCYQLNIGDVYEVVDSFKQEKRYDLLENLRLHRLVVFQPRYLEVNHSIMAGILLYAPNYKEAHFPFKLSAY